MTEAFVVESEPADLSEDRSGPYGGPAGAPERFSMSLLEGAERCLLLAHFKRTSDPSGEFAVVGNAVHDAIAAMSLLARSRGSETVELAEAKRIAEHVLRNPERGGPITAQGHRDATAMIERFAQMGVFPIEADEFVVELNSRIEVGDGIVTSARIDQAAKYGPIARVEDWKTGPGLPTNDAVRAHVQLPIYALHLAVRWPDVDEFHLTERWLRYGAVRPSDEPLIVTRAELGAWSDWIEAAAERLRAAYDSGEFDPTPGSWCANCPGKLACPLPLWQRPAAIASAGDALALFSQVIVQKQQAKAGEDALRAYLEAEGVEFLVQGDQEIGFKAGTRKSFDKKRALADLGVGEDVYTTESDKVEFGIRKARGEDGDA